MRGAASLVGLLRRRLRGSSRGASRTLLHATHRSALRRTTGPGIASLLAEFDGVPLLAARHATTSRATSVGHGRTASSGSAPSSSATHGATSSTASWLGGHHSVTLLHGVSSWSLLVLPRALHSVAASSSAHHLGNWVCLLHASWSTRTGHVHWHGSRVSTHGTAHWTPHHTWLSRSAGTSSILITPSLIVLRLQLRPSDIPPLRQRNKDGLSSNDLSIHLVHSPC